MLGSLFLVLLAFRIAGGALTSEFGGFDDEPAHVVTGLMASDYLVEAFPGNPISYAKDYYLHYPKVAIGNWPPFFYAIQSAWAIPFGHSPFSLLALMCTLTAGTGLLIWRMLLPSCGAFGAFGAAIFYTMLPLTQEFSGVVMTEAAVTLFATAALAGYGRYLRSEQLRHTLVFAFFAAAAILVKGTAMALGLVPVISIVLSKKYHLFKRRSFWAAAVIVGAICGPWYLFTLNISSSTWAGGDSSSLAYAGKALSLYGEHAVHTGGLVFLVVAIIGFVTSLAGRVLVPARHLMIALAGFVPAVLVLLVVVPSSIESRHLTLAAPAMVIGFALGIRNMASHFRTPSLRWAFGALLVLPFFFSTFTLVEKDWQGYRGAIAGIAADPELNEALVLVSSDSIGEGLFVLAAAETDAVRPGRYIVRATKALCRSDWMGKDYELRFEELAAMSTWLDDRNVGVIAIDRSVAFDEWYEHQTQLAKLVHESEKWERLGSYEITRAGRTMDNALEIWRRKSDGPLPAGDISLDEALGTRKLKF